MLFVVRLEFNFSVECFETSITRVGEGCRMKTQKVESVISDFFQKCLKPLEDIKVYPKIYYNPYLRSLVGPEMKIF